MRYFIYRWHSGRQETDREGYDLFLAFAIRTQSPHLFAAAYVAGKAVAV